MENKLNNKREKTEYVFSTLIYCKHCGYSFRRVRRKYFEDGKEYVRWVRSGRNSMGVGACPNATVKEYITKGLVLDDERLKLDFKEKN